MTDAPLPTALSAALAAGDVLRRKLPQARQVQSKGWRDIVTDADLAAEHAALDVLRKSFPDYRILSEEGGHAVGLDAPVPTWVIDPLDGTTNYARQFPSFSVSIALIHLGQIMLGVVHDPLLRETFHAEKGQGAFVRVRRGQPRPLRVSGLTDLGGALVGVDWARNPGVRAQVAAGVGRVAATSRTVRTTGSAALGLAYVAAGRLDGYFHLALQPWDVAAGALLVTEAGGALSTASGDAWGLSDAQVVASNGLLQDALVRTLALA